MTEHPERKHPRLRDYDYSLPGYYHVTIHTAAPDIRLSTVREGCKGGAVIRLTKLGMIIWRRLFELETRYPYVKIDKYVIMPTHLHVIIRLTGGPERPGPRPGIPEVVGAFKSLATRDANSCFQTPGRKVFQSSFFDTVLRNEQAYQECWRYIDGNPSKWLESPEE